MPMTEQLEQLPMTHRETIPYDYIDPYGRMIVPVHKRRRS